MDNIALLLTDQMARFPRSNSSRRTRSGIDGQVHRESGAPEASSYYSYNQHNDVDAITNETGNTRATTGYTAYGMDDKDLFTGVDKPDPVNPDKRPVQHWPRMRAWP